MVGENVKSTNAVFAVSYSPDANPSFLNGLAESIVDLINRHNDDRYPARPDLQAASVTGPRDRIMIRMTPYMTGTDQSCSTTPESPGRHWVCFPTIITTPAATPSSRWTRPSSIARSSSACWG